MVDSAILCILLADDRRGVLFHWVGGGGGEGGGGLNHFQNPNICTFLPASTHKGLTNVKRAIEIFL